MGRPFLLLDTAGLSVEKLKRSPYSEHPADLFYNLAWVQATCGTVHNISKELVLNSTVKRYTMSLFQAEELQRQVCVLYEAYQGGEP